MYIQSQSPSQTQTVCFHSIHFNSISPFDGFAKTYMRTTYVHPIKLQDDLAPLSFSLHLQTKLMDISVIGI